jgi:phage portal protein BeeE
VVVSGVDDAWFSPAQPMPPMAQQIQGRQFDYPFSVNLYREPKTFEGLGFKDLRALADNCCLVRLAIETRKDQMESLNWSIKMRDGSKPNRRAKEIQNFFLFPDKDREWGRWLRELLEDLFVIDAPTLYMRRTINGDPYKLEIVDGATIKRVVNADGRTPESPDPAYQQIIKGMPACDFTSEEIIYYPRNTRPNKIYGYSPVEQILSIINISIRRDTHKLNFYEKGTIPDGFITSPDGWNLDQLASFQTYLADALAGDLEARRQMLVLPSGTEFKPTKEVLLKDEMDEWLSRVICYAFSLNPQGFVAQMNRATSEVAQDASLTEGLGATKTWVRRMMNFIIARYFYEPDLCFEWEENQMVDPLMQAQIDQIYLAAGVDTENEVREARGKDPLGDDELAAIRESKKPSPIPQNDQNQPNNRENDQQKLSKRKKKALKRVKRNTKAVVDARKRLRGDFIKLLNKAKAQTITELSKKLHLSKADESDDEKADRALAALSLDAFTDIPDTFSGELSFLAEDGQVQALKTIPASYEVSVSTNLMHKEAVDFAESRAAELVTSIDEATREMLRADVTQAVTEGWSTDRLASSIEENQAFSSARAERIARTEIAIAHIEGSMQAYRASGVVGGKKWLLSEDPCPICEGNAADGEIGLDETFSSGDDAAPAHPNCECDIIAITGNLDGEDDA